MAKDPKELQHQLAEADKAELALPPKLDASKEINDLSELHVLKKEWPAPGSSVLQARPARVKVTHVTNGFSVIGEGENREVAKLNAYAAMAAKMGLTGAAAAYTDAANEAIRNYNEKLVKERDGDF